MRKTAWRTLPPQTQIIQPIFDASNILYTANMQGYGRTFKLQIEILSYTDLTQPNPSQAVTQLKTALLRQGIVGIRHIPSFEQKSRDYITAARQFAALNDPVKQQYAPNRDAGETEGYEIGAEWFQNKQGIWQIDDKKASYYAFVPNAAANRWPTEVDLKSAYLDLGQLIFGVGKLLLNAMALNHLAGLDHDLLVGYGRMLHYHKENDATNDNPDWCGAHFDHGVFTGLLPAYYFQNGIEVDEPEEAGLYIVPSSGEHFEKVGTPEKDVLLFQVGEFGQLASHDQIKATQHKVCKAKDGIERFSFALFYSAQDQVTIQSQSQLIQDERYTLNQTPDGTIQYGAWQKASFERYRAMQNESNAL